MTVPGKGGRPRKWASDRDRQRAWRARQQGRPEPAQIDQALDDGDLLAVVIAERNELAGELSDLRREAAEERGRTAREIERLRAEVSALDRRAAWAEQDLHDARVRSDTLREERDRLVEEVAELRAEAGSGRAGDVNRPAGSRPSSAMSRSERRRAARDARRRSR